MKTEGKYKQKKQTPLSDLILIIMISKNNLRTDLNLLVSECVKLAFTWSPNQGATKIHRKETWELEVSFIQSDENIDIRSVKSATYIRHGKQRHYIDSLLSSFLLVLMTFLTNPACTVLLFLSLK